MDERSDAEAPLPDPFARPDDPAAAASSTSSPGPNAPGAPDAPAPRSASTGLPGWAKALIAVGAAAAVLVAAVVGVGVVRYQRSAHAIATTRITIPSSIGPYQRATGRRAEQIEAASTAAASSGLEATRAGFYLDSDGQPAVLVVAARFSRPQLRGSGSLVAEFARGFAKGTGTAPPKLTHKPSGLRGGDLRCGHQPLGTTNAVVCVAVDPGALVAIVLYDENAPLSDVEAVRDAVEIRV